MRLVFVLIIFFCYPLVISCENNINMEIENREHFQRYNIGGTIGIRIKNYDKKKCYVVEEGRVRSIDKLPNPLKPSHQNPELSSEGYDFLPQNIDYTYQGPQLMSPDGNFTVASCVKKNSPPHRANTFIVIEHEPRNVINIIDLKNNLIIKGIAWSPKSDIFAILASQTKIPFQWNILRTISGHPTNSSDYYLIFYNKKGQLLFKEKIIVSLVDGSVQVVWMPK